MSLHQTLSWPCALRGDSRSASAAGCASERQRLYLLIRNVMGLPAAFYEAAARPVLDGALQRLCHPGDDTRMCAVIERLRFIHRVLALRRGCILPAGVDAEALSARAHRWTYGVFVAALFAPAWVLAPAARDAAVPEADGAVDWCTVSARIPARFLRWMEDDPALLCELCALMAAQPGAARGAIAGILRMACPAPTSDTPPLATAQASPVTAVVAANEESPPQTEAPPLALAFMRWLDAALAEGSVPSNEAGAAVHGVTEGLLLASPRIFRLFVAHLARTGALEAGVTEATVQRALLRAGWHERAPRGVNMLRYAVTGAGPSSAVVNGVVITHPGRFVTQVPAVNPVLRRAQEP